ncbi:hypothetical protein [Halarchaeum sp. P4]|uniref:hypothetical protein n=1 Tax=Halarchaeum sp. P4 TaxID=3421639 RepID=UPI003EBFA923
MTDSKPDPDVRFDDWPIESSGRYADWTVERASPSDEDVTDDLAKAYEQQLGAEAKWIGSSASVSPYLYVPSESTLYEAELDEENRRVLLREADRHEVGEETSLGERIEEIGEEHGWEWLSEFARDHLESEGREVSTAVEPGGSRFQQRNVVPDADHDLAFFGSHRFVDQSDREHVIERTFRVDAETGEVTVTADYLLTDPDDESEAELVADREYELEVDADPDDADFERAVERQIREWHEAHAGWPDASESDE